MRIEVLIGNEDPVVYPLNATKITLGTSENCDITLSAEGISRKHLTIISEGDNFYVIDQGSTNGTFINEDRLIPGRKTEFTSFFPVRLGDSVLISLISDEEGRENKIEIPASFKERPKKEEDQFPDKTNVISLKELNKVRTESLVQNRNIKRNLKRKTQTPPPPKKKINFVPYLSLLIFIGAAVYNILFMEEEIPPPPAIAEVGKLVVKKEETPAPPIADQNLISDEELVSKEVFEKIKNDIKCTTDLETYLCDFFPGARQDGFGVTQVGLTVYVLIDGSSFFDEAKNHVTSPTGDPVSVKDLYEKLIFDTGAYLYLLKISELPPLDLSKLTDMKISIALFRPEADGNLKVARVIAIKPKLLTELKEFVNKDNLFHIRTSGEQALLTTKSKYRLY